MKIRPLQDRILIKRIDEEEITKGGIIIPDSAKEKPSEGKVMDGVTVAKEIEFEDKFENMGAQMVKEVASKTSDVAGDGTTTATVLAQAIFREGSKLVAAGMNPMELKRGIDKAVERPSWRELAKISKPTRDTSEIAQVGTISANSDPRSAASSPRRWTRSAARA